MSREGSERAATGPSALVPPLSPADEAAKVAELRAELIGRGHRFVTDHSDTEVLLHGYREWGRDLPNHLNQLLLRRLHLHAIRQ